VFKFNFDEVQVLMPRAGNIETRNLISGDRDQR